MAETNPSSLQSLFHCLDPISLILSQNPDQPGQLRLATESFIMERGPRYRAYAELRESRLRKRHAMMPQLSEEEPPELIRSVLTPPKKQVKFFQANLETSKRKVFNSSSVVAQSVPDFSSVLRKENRKPLPAVQTTPPPNPKGVSRAKSSMMSNPRGSKSGGSGAGEKRGPGLAARKSYASIDELKGFSLAAARAINGERRTVLGFRAL